MIGLPSHGAAPDLFASAEWVPPTLPFPGPNPRNHAGTLPDSTHIAPQLSIRARELLDRYAGADGQRAHAADQQDRETAPYNPTILFHSFANSTRSVDVMSRAIARCLRIVESGKISGFSASSAVSLSLESARTAWAAGTGQT